jgi:hypothetical protein
MPTLRMCHVPQHRLNIHSDHTRPIPHMSGAAESLDELYQAVKDMKVYTSDG